MLDHDKSQFALITEVKDEPMDVESVDSNREDDEIDIELSGSQDGKGRDTPTGGVKSDGINTSKHNPFNK